MPVASGWWSHDSFVTSAAPPNVTFLPRNLPPSLRPTERGRRHEAIFLGCSRSDYCRDHCRDLLLHTRRKGRGAGIHDRRGFARRRDLNCRSDRHTRGGHHRPGREPGIRHDQRAARRLQLQGQAGAGHRGARLLTASDASRAGAGDCRPAAGRLRTREGAGSRRAPSSSHARTSSSTGS